jgi:hypothetical protein
MKVNAKTQLGIYLGQSPDLLANIEKQHVDNMLNHPIGYNEDQIQLGRLIIRELTSDKTGLLHNTNYLIRKTAFQMVEKIPVNDKFDIRYLDNLPDKKATYLLGEDKAFRYYRNKNNLHVIFIYYVPVFGDPSKRRLSWIQFRVDVSTGEVSMPKHLSHTKEEDPMGIPDFKLFVQLVMFTELSEITTEILAPNRKTSQSRKEGKILNESRSEVVVVDSKWNVISVRTEGFLVNGHWRLQPFGSKRTERRLIWIDTFEKHGYVRNKHLNTSLS